MKKYGEVIGSEKRKSVIRIYKEKNGELSPTSITITASDNIVSDVGDMVEVELNVFLFLFTTAFGYLLPFLTTAFAFFIISPLTDSILIIEAVLLSTLLVMYICTNYLSRLPLFKKIPVCMVLEKIELE